MQAGVLLCNMLWECYFPLWIQTETLKIDTWLAHFLVSSTLTQHCSIHRELIQCARFERTSSKQATCDMRHCHFLKIDRRNGYHRIKGSTSPNLPISPWPQPYYVWVYVSQCRPPPPLFLANLWFFNDKLSTLENYRRQKQWNIAPPPPHPALPYPLLKIPASSHEERDSIIWRS